VKACKRYEIRLRSTYRTIFGDVARTTVEQNLTLLEDHARFNGPFDVLLPYTEKNGRELLEFIKVLVEKAKLYAEAERLR